MSASAGVADNANRETRLIEALARAERVPAHDDRAKHVEARHVQLAHAYLHLALYYLALSDSVSAKRTFKVLLRLCRGRRLKTELYSPRVIALFEEARAEVAREAALPASRSPRSV